MKPREARRRLVAAGWRLIGRTGRNHTLWRTPDGRMVVAGLSHEPVDRNAVALVRRAEREARA